MDDIGIYLKLLESSSSISAKALLSVGNILEMANELIEYFSSFLNTEDYPHLNPYFAELYTNPSILDKIKKSIIDENTIADTATQTFSTIRNERYVIPVKQKLLDLKIYSIYVKPFI